MEGGSTYHAVGFSLPFPRNGMLKSTPLFNSATQIEPPQENSQIMMARNEERRPEGRLSQFVMGFESFEQETDAEHSGRVRSQKVGSSEQCVPGLIAYCILVRGALLTPVVPKGISRDVRTLGSQ